MNLQILLFLQPPTEGMHTYLPSHPEGHCNIFYSISLLKKCWSLHTKFDVAVTDQHPVFGKHRWRNQSCAGQDAGLDDP